MKAILFIMLLSALSAGAQSGFDLKISEAAKPMVCPPADESDPVTLNVQSVNHGDSIGIIVKVSIAPGWHIYAYVPPTLPYIAIDPILRMPENFSTAGDWKKSDPESSADDPGVLIYEGEAVFIRKVVKHAGVRAGTIKAGLYYQTCNLRQCLPPNEKVFEL